MPLTNSPSTSISLNIVPARAGITWVKLGIKTFFKQPLALAGLFVFNFALLQLLNFVPVVGFIFGIGLIPAFNVGMFVAIQLVAENQTPKPTTLFIAFKKNAKATKSILLLGVLYLVAFTALTTIFNLIYSDPNNAPFMLEGKLNEAVFGNSDFQTASLVMLILQIPVGMLFWHAPALVHWHDVSPVKALFFSWMACVRNFAPMVVYMFGWLSVFILGASVLTIFALLTDSVTTVALFTPPVALLIATMFFTSVYFTFKDSFITPSAQP